MKASASLEWGEEIEGDLSQRKSDKRKTTQKLFLVNLAKKLINYKRLGQRIIN